MLKDQKNSKKQGDVGMGIAIGWFAEKGYTVCVPLTDSQAYDLVIDGPEGLQKVQVKTTWSKRGKYYQVELRTRGGNRSGYGVSKKLDSNNVDLLFVVTEERTRYLIPIDALNGRSGISLGNYDAFVV